MPVYLTRIFQVTRGDCVEPMRYFISLGQRPHRTLMLLHSYKDKNATLHASVAAFMLAKGESALLRLSACVGCAYAGVPPWSDLFDMDLGEPTGVATEHPAGVFTRRYSNGSVRLDCAAFRATFGR